MSVRVSPATCEAPVRIVATPARPVRVRCDDEVTVQVSTGSAVTVRARLAPPVAVRVSCTPSVRRFELSTDENFILLPIAGGGTAQVPYDPVP